MIFKKPGGNAPGFFVPVNRQLLFFLFGQEYLQAYAE
jgi:hypothetical protein